MLFGENMVGSDRSIMSSDEVPLLITLSGHYDIISKKLKKLLISQSSVTIFGHDFPILFSNSISSFSNLLSKFEFFIVAGRVGSGIFEQKTAWFTSPIVSTEENRTIS